MRLSRERLIWRDALSQDPAELRKRIDTSKAHPARVYDVFLGGKDNHPPDREAAAAALTANPRGYLDVRHNRDFLRRAVTRLAKEEGIRQFLDIGTGLPTAENVHQIAQRVDPASRVVYVDNDPIILTHARALLTSAPEGATDYIDADLKEHARILEEAAKTLDLDRPVALVLVALLHFIEDDGLELDAPGVVPAHHWHFEDGAPLPEAVEPAYLAGLDPIEKIRYADINDVTDADINVYAATGSKP